MFVLLAFGYALAALPLIIAMVFSPKVAERRQKTLLQDIKELVAADAAPVRAWGGEEGIRDAVADYYSRWRTFWPTLFLSALYVLGFQLSYGYLVNALKIGDPYPFPPAFAALTGPVCMTFLGVYAFNMGTAVRRLYLDDLSDTMYWGSMNRLVLSEFLTLAIEAGSGSEIALGGYMGYFAIGFLANPFLARLLEVVGTMAKLGSGGVSAGELSLRSIQGINIWKEYRLEEEGIDSVENLFTSDVIGLAIKTHYSLRTLIDWVDQAMLMVRFREKAKRLIEAGVALSAIEFAWRCPQNGGNKQANAIIAQKLGMEPELLEDTMNTLFQDEVVQNLWRLWQSSGARALEGYTPPNVHVAAAANRAAPVAEDAVITSAAQAAPVTPATSPAAATSAAATSPEPAMDLKVGILIIGSLYWDQRLHRKQWRETRLATDQKFLVRTPIRYGRKSKSPGLTYTMVFSELCEREAKWGQAIVVRCKKNVSTLHNLVDEAGRLWAAEQEEPSSELGLSADWGCVALLTNPDTHLPQNLLEAWEKCVSQRPAYGKLKHAAQEACVVNAAGVFQISWPKIISDGRLVPLDILLATATDPTLEGIPEDYPTAGEIMKTWNQAPEYVNYFWENRRNEIRTFQDESIEQLLKAGEPR